jgi:hypothetical protein
MTLRLFSAYQLKSGGYGLGCGACLVLHDGRGNFCPGLSSLGWEVTVKACGVTVTMPQGQSRVPDPLTGQQ